MTIQSDARRKALVSQGFRHGVYDRDHQNEYMSVDVSEFGSAYLEGYKKGFEAAKDKRWYVVSLDGHGKPKHWFVENRLSVMNKWVDTKEDATAFPTEI